MHILLIDDSTSTRSLLKTLINSGQAVRHTISEAASGEEALQKVSSGEINVPDLVIMDINMGGMSGYELCREFRARHGTASDVIPYIIIVTANEGIDVINQALDSGANDYMPKPVNVKVLHVRLRVAERLLAQAQAGGSSSTPGKSQEAAPENGGALTREHHIGLAVDSVDAPIAIVDVGEGNLRIVYANPAMLATTQSEYDELMGRSLDELEAWTPEFSKMVQGYVERGAILSHAPMWSANRQPVPVHLSFYPVRNGEEAPRNYLVIHHF